MPPTLDRILFPTDFSACAEGAYRHAAWLAERFDAELHVLYVVEDEAAPERAWPDTPGSGHVQISMADVADDLGLPEQLADQVAEPDSPIEVIETEVVGRKAPDAILDYVTDEEIELVVIGTHGRQGWRRGVIGSVAESVVRRAPCPVLTVRPLDAPGQGEWPPRRVLLAADALPTGADEAVPTTARWAARLAVAYGARLDIVHVTTPIRVGVSRPSDAAQVRSREHQALLVLADQLRDEAGTDLEIDVTVRSGDPATAIRTAAEEAGTHLLVVGTSARQGASRALLGSVAETLIRTAPCPVLVARDALAVPSPGRPASQEAAS